MYVLAIPTLALGAIPFERHACAYVDGTLFVWYGWLTVSIYLDVHIVFFRWMWGQQR